MPKPLLLVDVDGVISLFGFDPAQPPAGRFQLVDGIPHFLSALAGERLRALADDYELVWCTGWEEKANEYLRSALALPSDLPHLILEQVGQAHWKISAIERFAGPDRPLAWIDDAHDDATTRWAAERPGPTLLIVTDPPVGLTDEHVNVLRAWARAQRSGAGSGSA